jgi:hypothetical protein
LELVVREQVRTAGCALGGHVDARGVADEQLQLVEVAQDNPGNQITAKIAFDVPPDTNLTACVLTLHDSMFSGGVKVSLDQ